MAGVGEARSHGNLRSALWRTQRLQPSLISQGGNRLTLRVDRVDAAHLVEVAERILNGQPVIDRGSVRLHIKLLGEVLLPSWFDEWVVSDRERLRALSLSALECLAAALIDAGRWFDAVHAAETAIMIDPYADGGHSRLIDAHVAAGHRVAAHRCTVAYESMLAELLGPTQPIRGRVGALSEIDGRKV